MLPYEIISLVCWTLFSTLRGDDTIALQPFRHASTHHVFLLRFSCAGGVIVPNDVISRIKLKLYCYTCTDGSVERFRSCQTLTAVLPVSNAYWDNARKVADHSWWLGLPQTDEPIRAKVTNVFSVNIPWSPLAMVSSCGGNAQNALYILYPALLRTRSSPPLPTPVPTGHVGSWYERLVSQLLVAFQKWLPLTCHRLIRGGWNYICKPVSVNVL